MSDLYGRSLFHERRSQESETSPNKKMNFLRAEDVFDHLKEKIDEKYWADYDEAVKNFEDELKSKLSISTNYILYRAKGDYLGANREFQKVVREIMTQEKEHKFIRVLRKIFIRSGLAVGLLDGDWEVERNDEAHSKSLGVKSQKELTRMISNRLTKARLGRGQNTSEKFVAASFGPGNGNNMLELEGNSSPASTIESGGAQLNDTATVQDAWNFVGVCDKFYFSYITLLEKFLKVQGYREGKLFCHFFVTQLQYLIKEKKLPSKYLLSNGRLNLEKLPELIVDSGVIALIITDDCLIYREYTYDGEFKDRSNTRKMDASFILLLEGYKADPERVSKELFADDLDPETLLERAPFHFRNIFVSDFTKLDDIFPKEKIFHYGSSVRGTSHLDNEDYGKFLQDLVLRIARGGLYIDDGIRRSYSREIRLDEVNAVMEEANDPTLRVFLIKDASGAIVSVLFERSVEAGEGEEEFFEISVLQAQLQEGHTLEEVSKDGITQFKNTIQKTKNTVMRIILGKFRDKDYYYHLLQNLHEVHATIDDGINVGSSIYELIASAERKAHLISGMLKG